jgi:hypothetical protein
VKLTSLALTIALATGSTACGGKQLTNRQVALGAVGIAAVVLIVIMLSTQCDEDNGNDCTFQKPSR